ncbi:hypothetical protein LCGC14_2121030 [marine sediment metagenome]|uniref:M23ase beta-sheet core domain-containing protein n=1 Tax=marine sediment metagenome TaxID=412755 RepID=A0A0F9ERF6_9ZZZZ
MILKLPLKRGVTLEGRDVIWTPNFLDFDRCISQYFAENKLDWYKKNFGLDGHNGLDIILLRGENIYATSPRGKVIEISDDESAGIGVVVWDYNNRYKTIYWHLKLGSVKVKLGQEVPAGTLLGLGNNTGWSTGDHLHFGLKKTNERGATINRDNGFNGAIDPIPFFEQNDMILTKAQVNKLYNAIFYRDADKGADGYVGKDLDFVLNELMQSEEAKRYGRVREVVKKQIENWEK